MIIQCRANEYTKVQNAAVAEELRARIAVASGILPLNKGDAYVVYAIEIKADYAWVFVADNAFTSYPFAYPLDLFDVLDPSMSRHWVYGMTGDSRPFFTFREWAGDVDFFRRLAERDAPTTRVFQAMKRAMDLEFINPLVNEVGQVLDDKWVMCPRCQDAFVSPSADGMIECVRCQLLMRNPLYHRT